jgi:hypothetical protein
MPRLPTDLDRSQDETTLLACHGYWSLHARLATFRRDLAVDRPQWREFADLSPAEEQRLAALLDASARFKVARRPD